MRAHRRHAEQGLGRIVIEAVGDDLDAGPFAGKHALDEHDPAVGCVREGVAAGDHALGRHFHRANLPDSTA